MTKVAISYRRDDTGPICGRIYDRLLARYGRDNVFIDIDAIPPGADFRHHLHKTIALADVLIVIIGPRWLGKKRGGARIFEENDWVRAEVEIALQSGKRVFPVLIDDTIMPNPEQLPESIREIAFLQAIQIDSALDFHAHVNKLIRAIDSADLIGGDKGSLSFASNIQQRVLGALSALRAQTGLPVSFRGIADDRATSAAEMSELNGGRPGVVDQWRAKPLRYWFGAVFVLLASLFATPYLEDHFNLAPVRGYFYQLLSKLQPRAIEPRYTRVVFISDEDYWMGKPAGRTPINRAYLADIVDRISTAGSAVIALDFSMHLPNPNAQGVLSDIPIEYRGETDRLVRSIEKAAAEGQKIVLSRTLAPGDHTAYELAPDIFQPYGICTGFDSHGAWLNPGIPGFAINQEAASNISCGYIALPRNMSRLPMPLRMTGNGALDSLSIAIVRAFNPSAADTLDRGQYFGSYIPESALATTHSAITAGDLFDPHFDAKRLLEHRAVLIGGHWQKGHYGSGDIVDMVSTPIGILSGTVVHQNFVEAVLDGRNYPAIADGVLDGILLAFGILAILLLAVERTFPGRLGLLTGLLALMALLQWVAMQALGVFLDAYIMVAALWLYSAYAARKPRPVLSGTGGA